MNVATLRRAGLALLGLAAVAPAGAEGQQSAFTIDDVFNVSNVRVLDFAPSGDWVVAGTLDLRGRLGTVAARTGDPTYVSPSQMKLALINTRSGDRTELLGGPATVASARFSNDSNRLALLVRDDDAYQLVVVNVETGEADWPRLPDGVRLAGEQGQSPEWTADGSLVLPVRGSDWASDAQTEFARLTEGPITVYRGDDPFLAWEALRRQGADVGLLLRSPNGTVETVTDPMLLGRGGYSVAGDRVVFEADVTQKTSYDVIFGVTAELRTKALEGGDTETLLDLPETRRLRWSPDRTHYAYAEKGVVYVGWIEGGEPEAVTDEPVADEETENEDAAERFSVMAVAPGGGRVASTSKTGIWVIDTDSKEKRLLVERSDEEDHPDRYDFVAWAPDGEHIYFSYGSGTAWERGLVRYEVRSGERTTLILDDRLYTGFRLSEDGSTFVFSAADGNRPYDLYAADADLSNVRPLLQPNPNLATKALGRTELVDYLDVDGDRLHGVLYYPVDYTAGTAVPTIFLVYERFFDNRFNSTIALLNNAGYAVMQPSVDLEIGFPGEAWMKGVTAAANELVRRGIADPERLGVHGTSYGGYATNLLITQTDRFAAAINISGKVDMISFYTDSPRLGVRNIHAPENSQDRIGATLWEQPQKYIAHSAVMFADRIETPLLLMTGEEDHNVPARTTLEMYFALRRLGKTVEWVNYTNGGHGMPRTTEEEVRDYHERILEWYDRFLKEDPAKAATDASSR